MVRGVNDGRCIDHVLQIRAMDLLLREVSATKAMDWIGWIGWTVARRRGTAKHSKGVGVGVGIDTGTASGGGARGDS